IPVMLMPFQEDGHIDYRVLGNLVEYYLEAGASGLFANCLSSEMFNLTQEEMLASVAFIVEKVNGRVSVVATGSFDQPIEMQAQFIKEIYKTGVDSVIVITSLMAKEEDTEETFQANVERLLSLTPDIPLGFYECPVPYKRVISPEFLGKLVKSGRIKYHKDTSLDIENVKAKIAYTAEVSDFGLYDAYMVHAVETLRSGSAGLSCIQGNYFPELVVWLCNHYGCPDKEEDVSQVQQFFIDNMDVMHATYPTSAKYVLQQRNLPIGVYCRSREESLHQSTKDQLNRLGDDYEILANRIGLSK